jgi:hypothetical protein
MKDSSLPTGRHELAPQKNAMTPSDRGEGRVRA